MHDDKDRNLPPLVEPHKRSTRAWWAATAVLAVAVTGACWYGRHNLQKHDSLLAQFPGVQGSLTAVGKRIDMTEEKLRAWAGDQDGLRERMRNLENRVARNLQVARKQAQELAAQVQQRMQAELDRRTESLQARLGRLESGQESERARLARLQEQIASVQQEMAQQMAHQIDVVRQGTGREIAELDQQMGQSKHDMNALAYKVDRQRIDFEVARNHSRELVPGISLGITRTNLSYRRVDGWLWLMPDRRTVWVRGQGVQQPVIFYSKEDGRPRELVITHVTKNSVAGYLLLPTRPATAGPLAAKGQDAAPAALTP